VITEQDLQEAIAECEGQRNPTSSTCMKLAAFYTIRDKMFPVKHLDDDTPTVLAQSYSYDAGYDSDTEFMNAVRGISTSRMLEVMDDMMTTLSVINPRLYAAVMRKLS
jgi:hypothetical protein